MLEVARRTVIAGSLLTTGGALPLAAMLAPQAVPRERLTAELAKWLGLGAGAAWLIAERLNWSERWPQLLVTHAGIVGSGNPGGGGPIHAARSSVARAAVFAIYTSRPGPATRWYRDDSTETELFGLRMAAFRSGRHLACLVQPRAAARCPEITLSFD